MGKKSSGLLIFVECGEESLTSYDANHTRCVLQCLMQESVKLRG